MVTYMLLAKYQKFRASSLLRLTKHETQFSIVHSQTLLLTLP